MANNTDPNKHIPPGVEFGTVERLAKTFRNLHGTFSDLEGENIVLFAKNVDKYQLQSLIPSLEMGMIVITCLQEEPYIRARRWIDTTDQDPDRPNADHWCEQPHQGATPFLPYEPEVLERVYRPARVAGTLADGSPDPARPEDPGQTKRLYKPMRPSVAAVRYQPEVKEEYCLKHYLLSTFRKRIDLSSANKYLATFKMQKAKQSCSVYIEMFISKFAYYATIQLTDDEQEEPGHIATRNAIIQRYVREGLCEEFRVHLDRHPEIKTFMEIDNEIILWSRAENSQNHVIE